MKKFLSLILLLAAVAGTANADNYFTLRAEHASAANDTLWFNPSVAGSYQQFYAVAHFDGYLDHWYLKITHPLHMDIYNNSDPTKIIQEGPAMNVPYINSDGDSAVYHALLLTKVVNTTREEGDSLLSYFSSTITDFGYWDPYNNGNYLSYGTIKWGPGTHDFMFDFNFYIPYGTMDVDINLNAALTSTADWRGVYTVNMNPCINNIHIHLGYIKGDVTGDGALTMADVTLLIDYLFDSVTLTQYQVAAADVTGDGLVTIADVTALSDLVLAQNNNNIPENIEET